MLEYFKKKYVTMEYNDPNVISFWIAKFRIQLEFNKRWYDEEWRNTCLLTVTKLTDDVHRDYEQITTLILDPTTDLIELYINLLKEKINVKSN